MKARALVVAAVAALLGGCGWVVLTQTRPAPADCPAPAPRQGYEKVEADAPDAGPERDRR